VRVWVLNFLGCHFCMALHNANVKRTKGCCAGSTQPIKERTLIKSFLSSKCWIFPIYCLSVRQRVAFSLRRHFFLRLGSDDSTAWIIDTSSTSSPLHTHGYRRLRNLIAQCSENKGIGGSLWRTAPTITRQMSLFNTNPFFSTRFAFIVVYLSSITRNKLQE